MPLFQIIFIFPIIFIFRLWKTRKVKAELGICNHRASDQYFAFDPKAQSPCNCGHFWIYLVRIVSTYMHIYVNTLSNLCWRRFVLGMHLLVCAKSLQEPSKEIFDVCLFYFSTFAFLIFPLLHFSLVAHMACLLIDKPHWPTLPPTSPTTTNYIWPAATIHPFTALD